MTVIAFPQRHKNREPAPARLLNRKAAIHGTFPSPSGGLGTMTGWMRLARLHMVSDQLCAAGVFSGELLDSKGDTIGVASRRRTVSAEIAQSLNDHAAVIGPVDVDFLGLTVSITAFTLDTGVVRLPRLRNLAGGVDNHQAAPARTPAPVAPTPAKAPPGLAPGASAVAPKRGRLGAVLEEARTTTMTSLAHIPTLAVAGDPFAVDTPAVPTRHPRPALTESIFVSRAACDIVRERRALRQQAVRLSLSLADGSPRSMPVVGSGGTTLSKWLAGPAVSAE